MTTMKIYSYIKDLCLKYSPFGVIVVILLFQFYSSIEKLCSTINSYVLPPYYVSYNGEWGVRRLIGTIVGFVFPHYVYSDGLFVFVEVFFVLLILLFSYFLYKAYVKGKVSSQLGISYLITLLLISPFSITYLCSGENFGRLEIYHLILVLFYLLFCTQKVKVWTKRITMLPVIIFGCLIHQVFVFLFMPFIFVTILDDWKDLKFNRKIVSRDIALMLVVAVFVLLLQFGNQPLTYEDFVLLADKTDIDISWPAFRLEYSSTFSDHWNEILKPGIYRMVIGFPLTVMFMLPMIGFVFFLWKKCVQFSSTVEEKLLFRGTLICSLPTYLLFFFTFDFSRWFAIIFLYHFIIFFYFIIKSNKVIVKVVKHLESEILSKPLRFFFLIVYMTCFEPFQAAGYFPVIENLISIFLKIRYGTC